MTLKPTEVRPAVIGQQGQPSWAPGHTQPRWRLHGSSWEFCQLEERLNACLFWRLIMCSSAPMFHGSVSVPKPYLRLRRKWMRISMASTGGKFTAAENKQTKQIDPWALNLQSPDKIDWHTPCNMCSSLWCELTGCRTVSMTWTSPPLMPKIPPLVINT